MIHFELTDHEENLLAAVRSLGPGTSISRLRTAAGFDCATDLLRTRRRLQAFGLWPDDTPETIKADGLARKANQGRKLPRPAPAFRNDADRIRYEFRAICKRRGWDSIAPRFVNWRAEA